MTQDNVTVIGGTVGRTLNLIYNIARAVGILSREKLVKHVPPLFENGSALSSPAQENMAKQPDYNITDKGLVPKNLNVVSVVPYIRPNNVNHIYWQKVISALRVQQIKPEVPTSKSDLDTLGKGMGYTALAGANTGLEFLKTRKQLGLDPTYNDSVKQIIAERGKSLYAPAVHLANRLSYRAAFTAVATEFGIPSHPVILAAIDMALSLPNENHRMAVALDKNTPCFLRWVKQAPLEESYKGKGAVFTRQATQWEGIFRIRGWLKENTPLDHDQATLAAVAIASVVTMPLDIVRNVVQDPRNAALSTMEKAKKTAGAILKGEGYTGGVARSGAQMIASALSVQVMEKTAGLYKQYSGEGRGASR